MIGRLKGTVAEVGTETAIVDVAGVGYEVLAAPRLLDRLAEGEAATLSIETVVREDFIRLYAFADEGERRAFRLLQNVQGVGAKAALAVLQELTPAQLSDAVAAQDVGAVERAQGVGKKLAQRIVTELAPASGALAAAGAGGRPFTPRAVSKTASSDGAADDAALRADAVSALANLGYDGVEARAVVARVIAEHPDATMVGDVIRLALRELAAA